MILYLILSIFFIFWWGGESYLWECGEIINGYFNWLYIMHSHQLREIIIIHSEFNEHVDEFKPTLLLFQVNFNIFLNILNTKRIKYHESNKLF